jgi:hypothetical protein
MSGYHFVCAVAKRLLHLISNVFATTVHSDVEREIVATDWQCRAGREGVLKSGRAEVRLAHLATRGLARTTYHGQVARRPRQASRRNRLSDDASLPL